MTNELANDKWAMALKMTTDKLKECQVSKNLQSCLNCDSIFGCEIRNEYVKMVYDSMNKGEDGDFEF